MERREKEELLWAIRNELTILGAYLQVSEGFTEKFNPFERMCEVIKKVDILLDEEA